MTNFYRRSLIGFLVLVYFAAPADALSQQKWRPPPGGGVVRDKVAALSIARAVWFSLNPSLPKSSEEVWQREMVVSISEGVWHIEQKPLDKNTLGGGLVMEIRAKDGKILMIMMAQ